MSSKCMVVLSGGQDSTTCLGWALQRFDEVSCVTFNYGQRHSIELEAAGNVREFYERATRRKIPHEFVDLAPGTFAGTSPLTNSSEALETYKNFDEMDAIIGTRVEKTFVPMRNAMFLTLAANRAVCANTFNLVTGVCQADNANYPDCRQVFVIDMEQAINSALGIKNFVIHTPLMNLSKAESIHLAQAIPFAYEALALSHTAYDGKYPPTSMDHASVLRAHGFEEAGVPDPLVVRAWKEGVMELPDTVNYESLRAEEKLRKLRAL